MLYGDRIGDLMHLFLSCLYLKTANLCVCLPRATMEIFIKAPGPTTQALRRCTHWHSQLLRPAGSWTVREPQTQLDVWWYASALVLTCTNYLIFLGVVEMRVCPSATDQNYRGREDETSCNNGTKNVLPPVASVMTTGKRRWHISRTHINPAQ